MWGEQHSHHGEQPVQRRRAGSPPVPLEEPLGGQQGWRPGREEARSAKTGPGARRKALGAEQRRATTDRAGGGVG